MCRSLSARIKSGGAAHIFATHTRYSNDLFQKLLFSAPLCPRACLVREKMRHGKAAMRSGKRMEDDEEKAFAPICARREGRKKREKKKEIAKSSINGIYRVFKEITQSP